MSATNGFSTTPNPGVLGGTNPFPSTTVAPLTGVPTIWPAPTVSPEPTFVPVWPAASGTAGDPNRPEDMVKAAVKFDGNKIRWDLIPWDALEELAALYTIGAVKYEDNNWLKGFRYGRTVAAMTRHLMKWWLAKLRGEDGLDHENDAICQQIGLPTPHHLTAAIWNLVALLTFELRGLGTDDRPTRPTK